MFAELIYQLEDCGLEQLQKRAKASHNEKDEYKLKQQRESAWNRRNDRRGACMAIYR